jgi:hypothetical protein
LTYYETVVFEYLRRDRALFTSPEYCIQLETGKVLPKCTFWYCDVVTVDFRSKAVFLCEISYSKTLGALVKRLRSWDQNWTGVCNAVHRDSALPDEWQVRPWLFVPDTGLKILIRGLASIANANLKPRITTLDMIQPWKCAEDRAHEDLGEKSRHEIPESMWI